MRRRSETARVARVATVAALASVAARLLAVRHGADALAIPLGVLAGLPGAAGYALGSAVAALLAAGVRVEVVVQFLADLAFVAGVATLWGARPLPSVADGRRVVWHSVGRCTLCGVSAFLFAVALQALLLAALDRQSFAVGVVTVLTGHWAPALVGGAVGLALVAAVGLQPVAESRPGGVTVPALSALLAVAVGWLGAGFLLSAAQQDVVAVSGDPGQLSGAVSGPLEPVVAFALGPGYGVVQATLALVAALAVTLALRRASTAP